MNPSERALWGRWTAANTLSEAVGLGGTFALIGLLTPLVEGQQAGGILLAFLISVASGVVEATVVGLAQWWAMHPWFQDIRAIDWWRGTLYGALIAYVLGYLPSTLMQVAETSTGAPAAEPPQWMTLLLATGLGIAAGAVLSLFQWLVLRRVSGRAGLWIPANMLAWACGMPLIFLAVDIAFRMPALWQSLLVMTLALLAAGAVVGAIHGRFLVVISRSRFSQSRFS